jgi:hypothetical protein
MDTAEQVDEGFEVREVSRRDLDEGLAYLDLFLCRGLDADRKAPA